MLTCTGVNRFLQRFCPASQSNFLSGGAPISCSNGGRSLLEGGKADMGSAVKVADLALGTGRSSTSQLTEDKEKEQINQLTNLQQLV